MDTKKRSLIGMLVAVLVMMVSVIPAISTVSASGFEDDDGNLDLDGGTGGGDFDWNEFAPVTWSAPGLNQTATDLEDGWSFDGNEDRQASALDDAFAGGTKQDNECPSVITQKANNKTDVILWTIGDMNAGDTAHLVVDLSGSVPAKTPDCQVRYLSGPWSALFSTDGITFEKSEYTGRVSVEVDSNGNPNDCSP